MPGYNIEQINYNQELVPCKYCPNKVKRSKLASHKWKAHKNEVIAERDARPRVQYEDNPPLPSTSSSVPVCRLLPTHDTENWNKSNYKAYNPLVETARKQVIRGTYYAGRSKQEQKLCKEFEAARMAYLRETTQIDESSAEHLDVYDENVNNEAQLEMHNAIEDGEGSELSWEED